MAQLSHRDYDRLERAVSRGERIVVLRRGTEFVVIPLSLRTREGREVIDARNPTTGDMLALFLDELDAIEPVDGGGEHRRAP
jgi:hypothetical protein